MIADSFQHPFIVVPETEDGLRRAIGEAHCRYTRYINCKNNLERKYYDIRNR